MSAQLQGEAYRALEGWGHFRHRLPCYLWLRHVPGSVHSEQRCRKFHGLLTATPQKRSAMLVPGI